ncbi:MAG: hypothetical protein IPM54_06520 [Polyangiaceae bacterium]|nr:hypothetical protein [Polyangiaceae bacterium]
MDEAADPSCRSTRMAPPSPLSDGLSPKFVEKTTRAFAVLDCHEPCIEALVDTIVAFADLHGVADTLGLRRIALLLVATNHAISRLSGPGLPMHSPDVLPTPSEWLLLASRERAHATLPQDLAQAIDDVVIHLDDAATNPAASASETSPLLDYGFGKLLFAIAGKALGPSALLAGRAMGKLVRLSLEVLLATRQTAHFLTPNVLRRVISADDDLTSRLDLAVVIACKPAPDKLPLLSFVGHQTVRSRINTACETWADESTKPWGGRELSLARALVGKASETIAQKTNSMRLFGFAKPPSLAAELDRSILLAVEALLEDPELREAWDVQRWGGFFTRPCVARLFPMGLCALALSAASVDITERAKRLLELRRIDGFPYFEDFPSIPPDADDLGVALQLAARIPAEPGLTESLVWPVEVLVRNTASDGAIPVWFEQDLRESIPAGAPRWLGSRCLAASANALIGLAEMDLPLPPRFLERAVDWTFRTWQTEGMNAVFFYGLPYTRFILLRLAEAVDAKIDDAAALANMQLVRAELWAATKAACHMDGSAGRVLSTACHLAALSCVHEKPFDPWPLLAYLMAHQGPDGLWPSEPLYLTVGKDNAPAAHGARTITAAMCLYALARARDRLRA